MKLNLNLLGVIGLATLFWVYVGFAVYYLVKIVGG